LSGMKAGESGANVNAAFTRHGSKRDGAAALAKASGSGP